MVTIRPRTDWEQPGRRIADGNPPAQKPERIDTTVIHWTGIANPNDRDDTAIIAMLQSMQADYLRNRGYSLGYLFLVDPAGQAWDIRGFDFMAAANSGHNEHTAPFLLTTGFGEAATPAAWATIRNLSAQFARRSRQAYNVSPVPHRELSGAATACPGDTLTAQIRTGIGDLGATVPEPIGEPMILFRHNRYADVFAVGAGALHLGPGLAAQFRAQGIADYVTDDDNELAYVCNAANFDRTRLTPL